LDFLERAIRRNVLLELLAELYEQNPSDVIAMKEWLKRKLDEPDEDGPRSTNHYLVSEGPDAVGLRMVMHVQRSLPNLRRRGGTIRHYRQRRPGQDHPQPRGL